MAGLRFVGEFERRNLMLEDVGEGQEAVLRRGDSAEGLDRGAVLLDVVEALEVFVVVLFVGFVRKVFDGDGFAEGEVGGCDVFGGVVVEG